MALAFLNRCVFTPASSGTGDFVVSSAVTGYLKPVDAGAVDGQTYHYFAQSDDLSQWEVGEGVYTVSTTTLARTTIILSSNSNAVVTFSAAPKVYMGGPLAKDMHWEVIGDTTISSPVATVTHTIGDGYAQTKTIFRAVQNDTVAENLYFGFLGEQTDDTVEISRAGEFQVLAENSVVQKLVGELNITFTYGETPHVMDYSVFNDHGSNTDARLFSSMSVSGELDKLVFFFSSETSDFDVATATNTTGGRIITYGLRVPD